MPQHARVFAQGTSPFANLRAWPQGKPEGTHTAMHILVTLACTYTQVFLQGTSLYAFKGLAGKVGPIGVHAAMLLILAGTAYSGVGGYKGSAMIAE
eukprot:1161307-Pelagomonas_calceolata.AAC.2